MLSTSARLVRLLTLLQSRRRWSGAELVERLEVDARTVRRDIDRLRELGYPVHASSGLGGGYQLGSGATMPPVALGDDEAVAVAVALRAAASSVAGMEDTMLALLARLDQLLPVRLRARVSALESVMSTIPGTDAPPADGAALMRVAAACRDRRRVCFAYRDGGGRATERRVEPMHLVHANRRWYLLAWDDARADFRTFRVDRARKVRLDGTTFRPRSLPVDARTFVARAVSIAPYRHQLRARLRGAASELARKVPHWCGVLEPLDADACVLHMGAETLEGLAAQMLIAGAEVELEVLDAPAFLPALRAIAARLARAVARA